MRYLALLFREEAGAHEPGSTAYDEEIAAHDAFAEYAGSAVLAAEALASVAGAVTIRAEGSERIVTDGPFLETAEVIGGFMVLIADDLDEALDLARRIPAARAGAVELRPVVEWFDRAQDHAVPAGARRYVALLFEVPSEADVPGTPAWEEAAAAHARFGELAGDQLLAGAALHPADTATTVRAQQEVSVTDGPFAETAEVIGGLYCVWATDREQAVALTTHVPIGDKGAVELREVMELHGA